MFLVLMLMIRYQARWRYLGGTSDVWCDRGKRRGRFPGHNSRAASQAQEQVLGNSTNLSNAQSLHFAVSKWLYMHQIGMLHSLLSFYIPLLPKIPHPPSTSLSPQNNHSSPPYFASPSFLLCSPSSPHLINRFPSKTPRAPAPLSHPPSTPSPALNALGLRPHALSSVLPRYVARLLRRR